METALRPAVRIPVTADPNSLSSVLAEVAGLASETLELQAVFERVATAIRRIIPLDSMGVVRILEGQWAVLHAATLPCGGSGEDCDCGEPEPLTSWSPRLRPRPGAIPRVRDAALELNPQFPLDAIIIEAGVRSSMWEPFRLGDGFRGGVWVSSFAPDVFTDAHEELLRPIAALLGSAVEHWRIWDAERRRRERLDALEQQMVSFAESLDVREIFARVATSVQSVLPHDLLVLTELDTKRRTLKISAMAGKADIEVPDQPMVLTEAELGERGRDTVIVNDIQTEFSGLTERERLLIQSGHALVAAGSDLDERRSARRPRPLSRQAARYGEEDIEVATRLADRIGLMLSHQRLAEEARIAGEARERAERLEATVETLTRELESRSDRRVIGISASWKEVLGHVGRVASSETTVLVTGESGTGKEIVAAAGRARARRAPARSWR